MPNIEIYWDDLTAEKQQEILDAFGENCNYDVFPITTISVEQPAEEPAVPGMTMD